MSARTLKAASAAEAIVSFDNRQRRNGAVRAPPGQIRPQALISPARRTALRNVFDGKPISRATCATGRPDSIATRTPRSISS